MNAFRYFLGTRRKQWRFLGLCIALAIAGCVYWLADERYFRQMPAENPRNSTKLRSYLFRVHSRLTTTVTSRGIAILKAPRIASNLSLVLPPNLQTTEQFEPTFIVNQLNPVVTTKTVPVLLQSSKMDLTESVSYNVHVFYYPWYGNPSVDGRYIHWNHQYLPHWNPEVAKKYQKGMHRPPDDIGSNFYPELGCYSSSDMNIMKEHMKQIKMSGAGVVVVSWYPPSSADDQGIPVDHLIPKLLDAAGQFKLKVTLHIEPYKGRDHMTVRNDVKYITKKYSGHQAFYKYKTKNNKHLPLLYVYDSYHTKPRQWAELLKPEGKHTIRNTQYDAIMIALMVDQSHQEYINIGGFDGFYTYFAANGFTYGSRWDSWSELKSFAERTDSIFIPSIGPGYIDTSVRPWNGENTRPRHNGHYYKKGFEAALSVHPPLISITSFNEWHEGTQIEKAVPKSKPGFKYLDYSPQESDYYLKLTRKYVEMFEKDG